MSEDPGVYSDPVNGPPHYRRGSVECIEAMRACATPEEFRGHLRLTALKYVWRAGAKGAAAEDCRKAIWYLTRLAEEMEGKGGKE